jgi:hypothetical protein
MHDGWWDDYKIVPNDSNIEGYFAVIGLLHTLDRFGLMEVRPSYRSVPHEMMDIWIDGEYYSEELSVFMSRFKKV